MFAFLAVTIDGYHEGPNRELDWHNAPDAIDSGFPFASGFPEPDDPNQDEVDTLVFGRVTYELMASYWPSPEAKEADPQIASRMNNLSKYVASKTLDRAEWGETQVINSDAVATLAALKDEPGKDIAILGSSTLTANLMPHGVVDELRILVNPTILGSGKPVLGSAGRIDAKLTTAKTFPSGNVLLCYSPNT